MELKLGSETSTHFNQTPGLHPKENTLHQQHGESLKTKMFLSCLSPADGSSKLPKCYVFLPGNVLVNVSDLS
jgi:hypothetical protein